MPSSKYLVVSSPIRMGWLTMVRWVSKLVIWMPQTKLFKDPCQVAMLVTYQMATSLVSSLSMLSLLMLLTLTVSHFSFNSLSLHLSSVRQAWQDANHLPSALMNSSMMMASITLIQPLLITLLLASKFLRISSPRFHKIRPTFGDSTNLRTSGYLLTPNVFLHLMSRVATTLPTWSLLVGTILINIFWIPQKSESRSWVAPQLPLIVRSTFTEQTSTVSTQLGLTSLVTLRLIFPMKHRSPIRSYFSIPQPRLLFGLLTLTRVFKSLKLWRLIPYKKLSRFNSKWGKKFRPNKLELISNKTEEKSAHLTLPSSGATAMMLILAFLTLAVSLFSMAPNDLLPAMALSTLTWMRVAPLTLSTR